MSDPKQTAEEMVMTQNDLEQTLGAENAILKRAINGAALALERIMENPQLPDGVRFNFLMGQVTNRAVGVRSTVGLLKGDVPPKVTPKPESPNFEVRDQAAGAEAAQAAESDKINIDRTVRREGDKWFVYSEDGDKKLGGPYDTREEALRRLAQIEGIKESTKFDLRAGDVARIALLAKRVGSRGVGVRGVINLLKEGV